MDDQINEQEPQHPQGGGPVGAGCGFLIGLVVAVILMSQFQFAGNEIVAVGIFVAVPLLSALFTYSRGDRFVKWLLEGLRGW